MKNKSELIYRFIELRVKGETYDEIVKTINVSKPTLLKWAKIYSDKISYAELALARAIAEEIARRNKQFILSLVEFLNRNKSATNRDAESLNRIYKRSSKKMYSLFKKHLKAVEFELFKTGEIYKVKINFNCKQD